MLFIQNKPIYDFLKHKLHLLVTLFHNMNAQSVFRILLLYNEVDYHYLLYKVEPYLVLIYEYSCLCAKL